MFGIGRKNSTRHWHVYAGISYAADCIGSYATKGEARAALKDERAAFDDWKWQATDPDAFRVRGSVRGGLVYIEDTDPGSVWQRVAYLSECQHPECHPDHYVND